MAALSWIICIATSIGSLAAFNDLAAPFAGHLGLLLLTASLLTCPLFWRHEVMANWLNGRMRAMACLALLLSLPLILLPAG
ncbi:MAG: hypothetical protein AB7E05_04790 [Sphingobium sp.]